MNAAASRPGPARATRRRVRRTALAAAVLAGGLVLTGCSSSTADQPGAAVIVGDQRVSDAQLSDVVDETLAQLDTVQNAVIDQKTITYNNVQRMTNHLLLTAAAEREGIVVTQTQVDDLIASNLDPSTGRKGLEDALVSNNSVPRSQVEQFAGDYLITVALRDKLAPGQAADAQQAALATYLADLSKELNVRVAPRYGQWDAASVSVNPVLDDLSTPAGSGATPAGPSGSASPTASPSP